MEIVVVAVRDSAAEVFGTPFFSPTTAMAVRSFRDAVSNPDSPFHRHPQDFILFEVASWNDSLGRFVNLEAPRQLVRALDMKEAKS